MQTKCWSERVTDVYIALMLVVFPFYTGGDYTVISAGKYRVFLVLCGGYIAAMAVVFLLDKAWKQKPTVVELCAAAYLLVTVLSAACSAFSGVWLGNGRYEGVVTIGIYVLSFLAVSRYGRTKPWQLWLLGGSVGVYAAICLLQIAGFNPMWLYPAGLDYADAGIAYDGAFFGTMGNAGLSGAYLSLFVPMLFAAAVAWQEKNRWLLLLPLSLGLVTAALMDVDAAAVGVGGSLLLAMPCLVSVKWRKKAALGVAAAMAGSVLLLWFWPFFPGTAGELHMLLHGVVDDRFGSGRIGIWRQLWERVPVYWLLGSGPDTVGLLGLTPFVGESAAGEIIRRGIDMAHNEYLNILICQGVLALGTYLGLLGLLCRSWMKSKRPAATILGCGILGYCIQAFFSYSMCASAPLFWLALGLLTAEMKKEPSLHETVLLRYQASCTSTFTISPTYMW